MTERVHFHFSLSCIGEGNGNPLQYSCLENPRDRGAWWAAVYGVAQSQTWLKRLSSSNSRVVRLKSSVHCCLLAWGCPQFLVAFCFIKVCKSRRQQRESQLVRWKSYSFVTKSWKWHPIAFAVFHLSLGLAYTQGDRLQKDVNARRQEFLGAMFKVCLPYLYQFSSVQSLSRVQFFVTPWTAAYQALLSMGHSRQEYWSGVLLPSPTLALMS